MGFTQGFLDKMNNNKKLAIIIAAIVAAAVIAFVVFLVAGTSGVIGGDDDNGDKGPVTEVAAVDLVHMERNITAAGKVTTGEKETVNLIKGKTLKAVVVDPGEAVRSGQALAYYTDGSHTDAPTDCIITGIHAPKSGSTIKDSHSIAYSDANDLYLKVTIPEDEINNVKKGDTAKITVNAKPGHEYPGEIIEKKDVSTTLLTEIRDSQKSEKEESEGKDDEDEDSEEGDDEEGDDEEDDEESDDTDEDLPDLDAEEDTEGGDDQSESEGGGMSYFSVNIRFANDGTIKPGMSAYSTITIQSRDDVLAVPVQAVQYDEKGKTFVYRENAKEGEKTYVKIGSADAKNVEILSGLKKGDKIQYDKY